MKFKNFNSTNMVSLLGLGVVLLSIAILATVETPRELLRKRGNQLFWIGVITSLTTTGFDIYFRGKEKQLREDSPWSEDPLFWQELEQEVFSSENSEASQKT